MDIESEGSSGVGRLLRDGCERRRCGECGVGMSTLQRGVVGR